MAPTGNTTQLQLLLNEAASGNDEAYGQFIAQSSERQQKLTRKMLRGFPGVQRWEATDDVFQTAALRLYRSLAEVRPSSVREFFGPAALQIRRTLLDLARHHYGPEGHAAKHRTDADGRRPDDGLLPQKPSDPSESLDDWVRFHKAVENLPEAQRRVFQLVWYNLEAFCQRLVESELMEPDQVEAYRFSYPADDALSFARQLVTAK